MNFPFRKKKKDSSEIDGLPKKRFRLRLSVNKRQSNNQADNSDSETSVEGTSIDTVENIQNSPAPEKKRKKKAAKPKKQKPKKVKREKNSQNGKRIALIVIVVIVAVVAIIVALFLLGVLGGATVEEQLLQATQHTIDGEYEKAQNIYDKLLEDDDMLTAAYLGAADNFLAQNQLNEAISLLEHGYAVTSDETISAKLAEIRPDPSSDETAPPVSSQPIVWKDAALERMVCLALELPEGSSISQADLEEVTTLKIIGGTHAAINKPINTVNTLEGYSIGDTLYTERGEIRSLDDLVHFRNLKKLTIGYNQISNISGIAGLTELTTVGLYCNNISDISALSSLTNLHYLYLYDNQISDLSALSGLSSLRTLQIQNNVVTSLVPIEHLESLTELYIDNNQISDISALENLDHLHFLFADNNQISDISVVEHMEGLTDISFAGNPVSDYTPAQQISKAS